MDREGKIITSSPDRLINEEPDNVCLPVSGTLRPSAHNPRHNAQLLLTMLDSNNMPWPLEPRVILQNVLRQFHQHGLYPVVAAEMEFYLVDPAAQQNRPQGCFHLAVPSAYSAFIEELESMAAAQRLPLSGIVSEAEAGQFELNMCHSHNVVDSCEQVLALRKLTGTVAGKFGYQANFMAKPFSELAGNGLHFHVSLNDANGDNVFASPAEAPNEMVRLSLAGMLELMPASLAIMAPGVNGFRRLRKNLDEPLFHSWGYNKRNAALRIPCSDARNRRIEYRLAGADANPYLVMATLLTGMLYGLERIDDEALANFTHASPDLPLFQQPALESFRQCAYLADHLGSAFCDQWYHGKLAELNAFERIVTAEELS
ncbi:glutamine synthetase family protein [Enterobacter sp. R4-368]|uniref:glutamine synthetase family protein n=1 Tax=Enterobacter sp. R4-368 TaxID=1166130 RepID=UPI001EE39654|nr:glutamine synthetase family protein [Enterobacter sp. R4-368]